jgi:hypothetical protein
MKNLLGYTKFRKSCQITKMVGYLNTCLPKTHLISQKCLLLVSWRFSLYS